MASGLIVEFAIARHLQTNFATRFHVESVPTCGRNRHGVVLVDAGLVRGGVGERVLRPHLFGRTLSGHSNDPS